jgi:hypothetical protein
MNYEAEITALVEAITITIRAQRKHLITRKTKTPEAATNWRALKDAHHATYAAQYALQEAIKRTL